MTNNPNANASRGPIEVKTVDDHFIVSQKRIGQGGNGRFIVSMTLEEARRVVGQLTKHIQLAEALSARDARLEERQRRA